MFTLVRSAAASDVYVRQLLKKTSIDGSIFLLVLLVLFINISKN